MGWFDWFYRLLDFLAFYEKRGKVVFIGLDNSGKTTLHHLIRDDFLGVHAPTQRATKEDVSIGGVLICAYDLGGHAEVRSLWSEYLIDVSAIVFLVDAADQDRFHEAGTELFNILHNESLRDVPVAVLGNKIDRIDAVSKEQLSSAIGLDHFRTNPGKRDVKSCELFMVSLQKRQFARSMKWVVDNMK